MICTNSNFGFSASVMNLVPRKVPLPYHKILRFDDKYIVRFLLIKYRLIFLLLSQCFIKPSAGQFQKKTPADTQIFDKKRNEIIETMTVFFQKN